MLLLKKKKVSNSTIKILSFLFFRQKLKKYTFFGNIEWVQKLYVKKYILYIFNILCNKVYRKLLLFFIFWYNVNYKKASKFFKNRLKIFLLKKIFNLFLIGSIKSFSKNIFIKKLKGVISEKRGIYLSFLKILMLFGVRKELTSMLKNDVVVSLFTNLFNFFVINYRKLLINKNDLLKYKSKDKFRVYYFYVSVLRNNFFNISFVDSDKYIGSLSSDLKWYWGLNYKCTFGEGLSLNNLQSTFLGIFYLLFFYIKNKRIINSNTYCIKIILRKIIDNKCYNIYLFLNKLLNLYFDSIKFQNKGLIVYKIYPFYWL